VKTSRHFEAIAAQHRAASIDVELWNLDTWHQIAFAELPMTEKSVAIDGYKHHLQRKGIENMAK